VCLSGDLAQALYRDGNEQKAALGAGTGILIGIGDLEIVRNAGTPIRKCLNGQEKSAGAPKGTISELFSTISRRVWCRLSYLLD
jgi:hypothetical protein